MKKLISILLAFFVFLIVVFSVDYSNKKNILNNIDKLKYFNDHDKNYCDFIMEETITEDDIVVFGSSELILSGYDINEFTHPENLFNHGHSNYNTILFGRGYTQSLQHAIDLGAIQNNLKDNKVVLILSPQWFTEDNIPGQFFTRNFSDAQYLEFLQNDNVSLETKAAIANRVDEMMEEYPSTYERVRQYENVYVNNSKNLISILHAKIYQLYSNMKHRYILWNDYLEKLTIDYDDNTVDINSIDFDELLIKAEEEGKKQCTNNEYGIFDIGFTNNFGSNYEKYKNKEVNNSYAISKEYDDLELFLQVCEELNVEPLIISVPVNGKWYDYTGFPKEGRTDYYENIRKICDKYNVQLADFSDKEYEMYFLRDSMHLGWKGWVYVNEEIYKFYCE